jgi:hypothetical protein
VLALALIHGFNWTFVSAPGMQRWTQLMVAGVGAMAFFRSSLFTVRVGDQDVGVGPGSFLQIFRDTADHQVDRVRAHARGLLVGGLMAGLDYEKAYTGLVPYALALMQDVNDEDQQKLVKSLDLLDKEDIAPSIKVRILGLQLMNVVGPSVLSAAVEALEDQVKASAQKAG